MLRPEELLGYLERAAGRQSPDAGQRAAILAPASAGVRILAGPGTGKTTCIVTRMLKLVLCDGVPASDLTLCVRLRVSSVIVLVVCGLGLAACGNSSEKSSSTTTSPSGGGPASTGTPSDLKKNVPVDAPGVTATEIKVDVITAKTNNPTGSYGPLVDGIEAYFNYRNTEDGGI